MLHTQGSLWLLETGLALLFQDIEQMPSWEANTTWAQEGSFLNVHSEVHVLFCSITV